jgi:23S rRNA m2A2503 methyltransferase
MIDIKSLEISELEKFILEIGEAKFRAKQIYEWLHKKLVLNFDEMSNLSLSLKGKLKTLAHITSIKEELVRISKLDDTRKYLFELEDGNIIESVLMKYKHGNSVCISSQVGCRMGCTFCASTIDGLVRNLTAAEMLDQVYSIQKSLGERISNIVIMGSGEPMDNYDNIVKFVRLITSSDGLNISQRNITISTCGIVPRMRKLAEEGLQVTLALSLHAPNDEIRRNLMPIAKTYSIEDILSACSYYFEKTGRRVSYEYSLVRGVNDNKEEAKRLIELLKHMKGHINLIPVNPIEERDYKESSKKAIYEFKNELERNGLNVTIRREMGRDIDGACGQLRRHYKKEKDNEK